MRLAICAIGRMKAGPETQLLARYLERATRTGRQLGISGIDVREFPESREQGRQARCLAESATLLKCVSGSARIIALDETGKDETSLGLAEILFLTIQAPMDLAVKIAPRHSASRDDEH